LSSTGGADTVRGLLRKSESQSTKPINASIDKTNQFKHVPPIYKICPASAWREAERLGVYRGSADDARDGFIHFSTATQVNETARKHFFGQTGLFLIEVDAAALGDELRWERSRNDELFPHLYGQLDLGAVLRVISMHARSDGTHDIPELKP
jgi:uncharacterized protein (DUF952 family)